jgi:glycosyltransferase involved in cell wall biosynthesis
MILSILIPSIPSRFNKAIRLYKKLLNQANDEVEILLFCDNKKRSIGEKRNDLVQLAKGKYLAFVDDDDSVSDNYVSKILKACKKDKDVICFRQLAEINDLWTYVDFGLNNENEEIQSKSITRRKPFHVCPVKSSIAKKHKFANVGYGEDWHWMERVLKDVKTECKINDVLHFYKYKDNVSEAPTESNEIWRNKDLEHEKGSD